MGVIVFIIIGIIICGFCAMNSEQAAEALKEQQSIDEAKLKELKEIRRAEKEAKEKARMAIKVKREANKRAKKIKFETMVLDEMKKGRD